MEQAMLRRSRVLSGFLSIVVLFSACRDRPPTEPPPPDRLFGRYVALGNSVTAGFESDGINDSTQAQPYAVGLAASFEGPFNVPLLRRPGCPPPLVGPITLTNDRVGGADPASCAGFETPIRQPVQNLSFPGFTIAEALTVPGGVVGLVYRQAFGNRSLVQAMIDANPTLVSVWLGNNDVLSAMTTGDIAHLTPLAEFEASLATIMAAVAGRPALRDAVLIGVADPLLAPLVQPGAYFWLAAQDEDGATLLGKPVNDSCAPLGAGNLPNPPAANLVSFRAVADPAVTEISCADDAPYVLNPGEQAAISARVAEFNHALRQSAAANGWIYIDANEEIVQPRLADPDRVRKCQALPTATTPEALRDAVEQTCPHPTAPNFFGANISFDGIHPSREGQQVIAEVLRAALVQKHGPDL
jgi:lysophospholipase L1-like esterase